MCSPSAIRHEHLTSDSRPTDGFPEAEKPSTASLWEISWLSTRSRAASLASG